MLIWQDEPVVSPDGLSSGFAGPRCGSFMTGAVRVPSTTEGALWGTTVLAHFDHSNFGDLSMGISFVFRAVHT